MLGYLSTNWNSTEVGWCNRTTTQNTEINQQQNGFNRRKYAFWSGPVSVLTSTWLRCCGMTSRAVHTRHPKNIAKLRRGMVQNSSWPLCRSDPQLQKALLRLLLPKEGQPVIKSKGSHTFSSLHCECLHSVFKDMKTRNCLCVIILSRLCLSIVVT
jgi:hypothetical protein